MAQFARPNATTTNSAGWTEDDGTTTTIHDQIDESTRDDADYVMTALAPTDDVVVFALSSVTDPAVSSGHILRYALGKNVTGGEQINWTVQLRQGYTNEGSPGTLIHEWFHEDVDALTLYEQTLGPTVADAISNYGTLSARFVCTQIVPPEVPTMAEAAAPPAPLRTVACTTLAQLNAAIAAAIPGDLITVAAGTYSFGTLKTITLSGTAANPIVIQGVGPTTILTCGSNQALDMTMCDYVQLRDLRITNNFFGLRLKGSQNCVLDGLQVDTTQNVGISIRREGTARDSAFVYVQGCNVFNTGIASGQERFGEGVYVGGNLPDTTHDIYILNNTFATRSNAWEFSAETHDCWAEGNTADGTDTVYVNGSTVGLVDVRGPRHTVVRNNFAKGNPHCINFWQDSGHLCRLNVFDIQDIHALDFGYGINVSGGATGFWGVDNTFLNVPPGGGTIQGGSLS